MTDDHPDEIAALRLELRQALTDLDATRVVIREMNTEALASFEEIRRSMVRQIGWQRDKLQGALDRVDAVLLALSGHRLRSDAEGDTPPSGSPEMR